MPGQASKENGKKGGRPKGAKSASTLEKERVLAEVRERIMRKADILLNAQSSIAQGQQFLYKIEKTKIVGPKGGISYRPERPKLVTSEVEIQAYLDGLVDEGELENENDPSATYYFITTKEPNNMALDSMFNRAFGKPTDYIDLTSKGGKIGDNNEELKKISNEFNKFLKEQHP